MNDTSGKGYTAQDIRFTSKGDTLYAIALAWPKDGRLTVKSLAADKGLYDGEVGDVQLLGHNAKLKWTRGSDGLVITVPPQPPCEFAFTLRIERAKK